MTSRIATSVRAALVTAALATLASASPALAALPSGNLLTSRKVNLRLPGTR